MGTAKPTATPAPEPQQPASDPKPTEAPTGRLLRQTTAELQALRRQVADVPTPDELATLRAEAEQFRKLREELPTMRQEIAGALELERQRLAADHAEQTQALSKERQEHRLAAEFLAHGGLPSHLEAFSELLTPKLTTGPDGSLMVGDQLLPDFLAALKTSNAPRDAVFNVCFRPNSLASGSGMSGDSGSVSYKRGTNIHSLSKGELGDLAFGG